MPPDREIILEFQTIGRIVKVTAIDPDTLVEVSIQGPVTATEAELRRIAIAKLDYVLSRRARDNTDRDPNLV